MKSKAIKFSLEQEYSIKALAIYLANLENEGVTYSTSQDGPSVIVELTGGF